MDATTAGRYRVVSVPGTDERSDASVESDDTDEADCTDDGDPPVAVLLALPGDGSTDDAPVGSVGSVGSDGGRGDGAEGDLAAYEPVRVAADGYEEPLAADVADLEPGYVVDATVEWTDGGARFAAVDVDRPTRYLFADGVTDLFEAARDAWDDARAAGDAMASRVTRDTDGEPNGALYVFADAGGDGGGVNSPVRRAATAGTAGGGGRDLFAEFRDGTTPIDPLVERANEGAGDGPREVFVLRPADGRFVVVYIAFERDGLLAQTVRDTYF
ncbi:DUF6663 family protein [Candidatus Halobonum tyrrellensis]|uniref:Uncharacterized protein n=1 Tax=Candidatus Halobonum tyrrellensis G22 TaxID=1324957 RepID=V4HHU0_9EURY|nr:DUF6663 family protein [Candidatus Halobonum tyrrellensis]ESP89308.1 hypothetical protein K933_04801 [Candidatus Halobonum tyrrellensis G22]